jgi:glycosyltransferase involved in cell wall biosynthesis
MKAERIVIDRMTVDVSDIIRRSRAIRSTEALEDLRGKFGFSENQTVFIYVGRLEFYKGIRCLFEAFEILRRTWPEAALLVVGDGPERTWLEAAVRGSGSIRWAGRLDYENVIRAYNCADVAVVPSLFEPWGLVVNEAMAVGLPVIASDRVGCVDDLVRSGETGFIFPSGSAEELSDAMSRCMKNPQQRVTMGAEGRRLISGWTLEEQARTIVAAWGA